MIQLEAKTIDPQSYESRCKALARAVRQRLMNPKNGISERKGGRPTKRTIIPTDKPIRKGFKIAMDPLTIAEIQAAYERGTPIESICERFHISSRTFRRLRQKQGWPIRERIR
jgi:hypothetical protein